MALAQHWDEAIKDFGRGKITAWIETETQDQELANTLMDIAEDRALNASQQLSVALLALAPSLPLVANGELVTNDWLAMQPGHAVALLDSGVPHWLRTLRQDPWLEDVQSRRKEIWGKVEKTGLAVNHELAERLILTPKETVRTLALECRASCHSSPNAVLQQLIERPSLDEAEAVLLLAVDRQQLWTKEQEWKPRVQPEIKAIERDVGNLREVSETEPAFWNLRRLSEQMRDQPGLSQRINQTQSRLGALRPQAAGLEGTSFGAETERAIRQMQAVLASLASSLADRKRVLRRRLVGWTMGWVLFWVGVVWWASG